MNIDEAPEYFDFPCPKCGEKKLYWRIFAHLKFQPDGWRVRCYNKSCNASFTIRSKDEEYSAEIPNK